MLRAHLGSGAVNMVIVKVPLKKRNRVIPSTHALSRADALNDCSAVSNSSLAKWFCAGLV